jgi:hypothetical protein
MDAPGARGEESAESGTRLPTPPSDTSSTPQEPATAEQVPEAPAANETALVRTTASGAARLAPVEICVEFGDFDYADVPRSAARPPGFLPLPKWCTTDPNINARRYNRSDSCGIAEGLATITNLNTGAVICTLPFLRHALLYTVPGDTDWRFQIEMWSNLRLVSDRHARAGYRPCWMERMHDSRNPEQRRW